MSTITVERPEFVGIGEAADFLGLSRSSIQKLVDQGRLEAMRTAGGHRRILRGSLLQLRDRMHPGRSATPASFAGGANGAEPALRVMVVDDDDVAVEFMRSLMARHAPDIACTVVRDGMEAAVQLDRVRPHIVITDLNMKPYDGFRLIRLIDQQRDHRHVCVIAISALSKVEIARRGGLPPGTIIYPKPVPVARLVGYLEAHVQSFQKQHPRRWATAEAPPPGPRGL